ncbi:hypothetical protein [Mesorhizobium sp. WSM1293]|uniref:hypothetical protein n=1 Tax=Mesorhizobium sp. WSM1293 TaxID=1040984 RepID=UPI001FD8F300|nr:hypothetical protein [Mesorhizobium sp. WSM1293]
MNKFTVIFAAVAVASSVGAAEAGCGCGGSGGWGGNSSSLINVSPSIDLGKITALNDVLSGNKHPERQCRLRHSKRQQDRHRRWRSERARREPAGRQQLQAGQAPLVRRCISTVEGNPK